MKKTPSIDPDLKFNPSNLFRGVLSSLRSQFPDVPSFTDDDELKVSDIKWIYDHRSSLPVPFNVLMRETDLCLPSPLFPPRDPELEARVQKLRAQEANREYKRMTANVSGESKRSALKSESLSVQVKEVNRQLLVVFQLVVSVVTSFVFGYSAPYYLYGVTDVNFRLCLGLVFGFIVGVADLYFVIKYMLEMDGVITRGGSKNISDKDKKED